MNEIKEILSQYSVLYAEDDKNIQTSVAEYLTRYFAQVHIADDGKEALQLYNNLKPDVLFLDIDMPYINGLDISTIVRDRDDNIPIIILTAHTDTDKLLYATELKLCKYLVKPVKPSAFKEALERLSIHFQKTSSSLIYLKDSYSWDKEKKILRQNNLVIALTQKEQALLSLLLSRPNHCITYADIEYYVWDDNYDEVISIQSIKLQVTLLRKKLPKDSIKNVYGKGYIYPL